MHFNLGVGFSPSLIKKEPCRSIFEPELVSLGNQDICRLRVEELLFTGISKMVVYILLKPTNSVFSFLTAVVYLHHTFIPSLLHSSVT